MRGPILDSSVPVCIYLFGCGCGDFTSSCTALDTDWKGSPLSQRCTDASVRGGCKIHVSLNIIDCPIMFCFRYGRVWCKASTLQITSQQSIAPAQVCHLNPLKAKPRDADRTTNFAPENVIGLMVNSLSSNLKHALEFSLVSPVCVEFIKLHITQACTHICEKPVG